MLRLILATLVLTACALCQAQLVYPEEGKKYEGGFAIADDVMMGITLTWQAAGDAEIESDACFLSCQGKKHAKHADCDASCCWPCPTRSQKGVAHRLTSDVTWSDLGEGDEPPSRSHEVTMGKHYGSFGIPDLVRPAFALRGMFSSQYGDRTGELTKLGVPMGAWMPTYVDHWNKTPCSSRTAFIAAKAYIVTAEFDIYERGPNFERKKDGPKFTLRFRVLIPDSKKHRFGDPVVACKCEVKQEPKKEVGVIPGWDAEGEGEYAWVDDGNGRRTITGSDLEVMVTNISCDGMTEADVTCTGQLFIPAGWELDSVDGKAQDVQIQVDLLCAVEVRGLLVSIRPEALRAHKLRALCLEIEKPEPAPGMKYRLAPPRNPGLARLARLTRGSRFGGPWDQVRLWIASDLASYDRMAKTLVPMVGERTYARELYRASLAQAINPGDPRVLKLMEPRFLFAKAGDPDATAWLARELLRADGAALLKWIRGQKSAMNAALAEGDDGVLQVGAVLFELVLAGSAEDLETAKWMLEASEGPNKEKLGKTFGALQLSAATTGPLSAAGR